MSKHADSERAHIWLDGDAFRAPKNTELPTDPFAETLSGWDAFGGIEAGVEVTTDQNVEIKEVWNKRGAAYKPAREPVKDRMKFRAVDASKATLLTRAQGGKVTTKGSLNLLQKGEGEEFAFLVTLNDGTAKAGFYSPRVTLAAPPVRAAIDGKNLDGWEFDVLFLEPLMEILPALPDGVSAG